MQLKKEEGFKKFVLSKLIKVLYVRNKKKVVLLGGAFEEGLPAEPKPFCYEKVIGGWISVSKS